MKTGILILAHNNPNQLKYLVEALKQDFSIFVHIDAKCDIPVDFIPAGDNVFVFKKHKIHWGDENTIYAMLDLFRISYERGCDYSMLVSGADLPIKPLSAIKAKIQENPEINYVHYEKMPRSVWPLNGGFDRLTLYWDAVKNRNKLTVGNYLFAALRAFQRITGLKRKILPMDYYGGSTWLNLSREMIKLVLDFIEDNPKYVAQFRHTRNADEIFFQTIILNSKLADKVCKSDLRYVDWTSGPEYPRTLTMDDYDKIMQSDALFARKFDEKRDDS
ncbi:MAG: hypothetical protein LBR64_10510, partial [Dysgonamonadaceae bacterium]|nr:hypothetical protein [Dysgonamonadaceae bacterium]